MADEQPEMRIRLKSYQTYGINADGTAVARLIYHCDELGGKSNAQILAAVRAAAELIPGAAVSMVEIVDLPRADCCDVAVNYRDAVRQEDAAFSKRKRRPGEELWGFDVSGGTATVRRAIRQVISDGAPIVEDVADYIGWNGKYGESFQCAGVNILVPTMRETCRLTLLASAITANFRRTLGGLVGKVNNATFHDWAAGEVLFAGASLSAPYYNDLGQKLVDVTYSFNIHPNEEVDLDYLLIGETKKGWDYIWTISQFDPAVQKNEIVAATISQVYEYADLTDLGIGGGSGGSAVVTPAEV